jgi:hypothetical protein
MRRARDLGLGVSSVGSQARFLMADATSRRAIDGFSQLLRRNGAFAVSEISKGVVIIGFGDFATADAVGEFVSNAFPPAASFAAALAVHKFS